MKFTHIARGTEKNLSLYPEKENSSSVYIQAVELYIVVGCGKLK